MYRTPMMCWTLQVGSGAHGVCGQARGTDTKHTMTHVLHKLLVVVISSGKEMLESGVESCGGVSVKDWISLLTILHLPERDLHIRHG